VGSRREELCVERRIKWGREEYIGEGNAVNATVTSPVKRTDLAFKRQSPRFLDNYCTMERGQVNTDLSIVSHPVSSATVRASEHMSTRFVI
jgi:hypothetical protein